MRLADSTVAVAVLVAGAGIDAGAAGRLEPLELGLGLGLGSDQRCSDSTAVVRSCTEPELDEAGMQELKLAWYCIASPYSRYLDLHGIGHHLPHLVPEPGSYCYC